MTSGDQRFVRRWGKTRQIPIWWYALRFGLLFTAAVTAALYLIDYLPDRYLEPFNRWKEVSQIAVRVLVFTLGGVWNWFMNERRYQRLTGRGEA